jgi:serine/threonine protein kinase
VNELQGVNLGGCELLEEIGQGGMGVIYRAKQLSLDRIVAVKILAHHLAHDPSFVERFQREARAIAKINHPNILGVYDVGHHEKWHYMIMELVDGSSMAELLETRGILEPGEAAELISQGAKGLECAANQNIIHRDVKPDNIMLTSQHVVKVSDFGLAKELDSTMTETQAVMGTPAYMSPEQCDGRDLDSRTDIYSLGGTFYRTITGRLPFEADTAMSMMYRHKHVPLTPPRDIIPTLPESISNIICRMMAKERDERFQSMGEVVRALEEAKQIKQAFDPGRTMPVGPPPGSKSIEPRGDESGPTFLQSDTRTAAPEPSHQELLDTQMRCRETAEKLLTEGKLAQAARELRRLLELVPDDDESRAQLRIIEEKVAKKRQMNGEIRALVSSSHYEEALDKWNAMDKELRDEQIATQMERLASTVVPSLSQAAKADQEANSGHLEAAVRIYEEALKLDPGNEKAKQGLKSVEKAKQRIQFLLKEGYGHRQNRDYGQAIEVWEKILTVEPDNSQARRLIIEVRMAAASEAYNAEDFDKAVKHCEGVLKIDEKHAGAGRTLADAVTKRDRVAELRRRAELSRGKGDLSGSVKAYRELSAIVPKSRVARDGLTSTRKALSQKRSKRLLFLLVLLALVGGGYFSLEQWRLMDRARKEFRATDYTQSGIHASRVWHPIWKAEAQKLMRKARLQSDRQKALKHETAEEWQEAAEVMKKILGYYEGPKEMIATYQRRLAINKYKLNSQQAQEIEETAGADHAKWKQAETLYNHAMNAVADIEALQRDYMHAKNNSLFCMHVALGLKKLAANENYEANTNFQKALQRRPDTTKLSDELRNAMKQAGVDVD